MYHRKYNFTHEQFLDALKSSFSYRQIQIKLGLPIHSSYGLTVKRYINKHELDSSHLTGATWKKGQKTGPRRPISEYLGKGKYNCTSSQLKDRLLNEGYFKRECQNCKLTTWRNEPIPLDLHHKNKNHDDNSIDNLQVICPNCHRLRHREKPRNITDRT